MAIHGLIQRAMSNSQLHNVFAQFAAEQASHAESMVSELTKIETQGAEQARLLVDEWAKISHATLAYGLELSNQWRKLALDAGKRSVEAVAPKG